MWVGFFKKKKKRIRKSWGYRIMTKPERWMLLGMYIAATADVVVAICIVILVL